MGAAYNCVVDTRDRALSHQIHPVKLAADISTAVASLRLLWQHHLAIALVVMFVPPIVASAALVARGRLDWIAASRFGQRMHRMTPALMAIRLLGMLVMLR